MNSKSGRMILSLLSLMFMINNASAFTQSPAFTRKNMHSSNMNYRPSPFQGNTADVYYSTSSTTSSSTSLQMMDLILPFTMSEISIESFTDFDIGSLKSMTSPILISSSNASFESRFFADSAHLILDFATICSPDTLLLRLLIFLGRIFSILSDYFPDHSITADELVFQCSMLAISKYMFLEKFRTTISSVTKETSFQDRKIFKKIFCPAGFSFAQYKTLLSLNVLEWVYCKPGQFMFEDESSILITYKGSMQQHQQKQLGANGTHSFSSLPYCACQGRECYELIGNITQAYETIESRRKRSSSSPSSSSSSSSSSSVDTNTNQLLRAGPSGGSFLRINMKPLLEKFGGDADVTESIKSIYFNAIQRKLSSYNGSPDDLEDYQFS